MKWKYLFFCLFFYAPFESVSQIGSMNSIFPLNGYGFFSQDSNNYLYDEMTNYPDLTHLIDSICPFGPADFFSNLDGITTSDSITKLYGLHNQVPWKDTEFVEMRSSYSFNNKSSYWYGFYKKSWGDTNVAFLVIPGSGLHESIKIASGDTDDYHNMNGRVREKCLKYGDFYVYSKQNENFNSIWKNVNGLYQRLDYDYLTPYTDFNGNHWAANMYIDIVAAVRQLKKKYKKVIVMGLSNGGFPAMICGLQGGADGINCASGISSFSYNGFVVPNNENPYFANLLNVYTFDSIKGLLNSKKSEVLFSYGDGEGGGNGFEYNTHSLEDTFANHCNAKFYYGFTGHTFPTNYYDTFFTNVIKQPNVRFTLNETVCTADSILVECRFRAMPPLSFNLYRNNVFVQNMMINDTVCTLHLFDEGDYQLRNVTDMNIYPLCKSAKFTYTKDKKAIIDSVRYAGRNCNLQAENMKVYLTGNPPFLISSTIAGSNLITENNLTHTYALPVGSYQILSVQDSNNCVNVLNYPLSSTRDSLLFQSIQSDYDCDSFKTKFKLSYRGTSPWTLQYALNGQVFQRVSYVAADSVYIGNGLLNFISLRDSTNCVLTMNQTQMVFRDTTNVTFSTPAYSCDSNKMYMQFHFSGNAPWIIYYSKDAINHQLLSATPVLNAYFGNGQYMLQAVTDASGCSKQIGQAYTFNTQSVNAVLSQVTYDCDSLKTKIHFDLQGNPPFIIHYTQNGISQQWVTSASSTDKYFSNGTYYFSSITDSTNCSSVINSFFNFNPQPIQVSSTLPVYDCNTNKMNVNYHFSGNGPFTLHYTQNMNPVSIQIASADTSIGFGNGLFNVANVTDATGCTFLLNNAYTFNNDTLELTMGTPAYSCDSNKTKIHFELEGNAPFTIYYFHDLNSLQLTTNQTSFDAYFADGNYFFYKVKDATDCSRDTTLFYNFSYQPLSGAVAQQFYNCDSNKYQMNFTFTGSAPWHLEYTDGTNIYTETSVAPNISLFLNNGNWVINKVSNDVGCIEYFNLPVSLSYNQLSAAIVNQTYDCDSNKLRVKFTLAGNSPWIIQYVKNGPIPVYLNDTTGDPNYALYLPNGSYTFLNVKDNTNCNITTLFQTAYNNYTPLSAQQTAQSYDCDSNKVKVDYTFTGDAPFVLNYVNTVTGTPYTVTTNSASFSLYLTNGIYVVLSVSDTKCIQAIQDTINVNFEVLNALMMPMVISCDSSMYTVQLISHGGHKPYTYAYNFNGNAMSVSSYTDTTTLFLPNGNYHFTQITDSAGCIVQFNNYLTANYTDFHFNAMTSEYLCAIDSTQLTFDITHQQPLWMAYTMNGNADTLLVGTSNVFNFSNGNYDFMMLFDSVGCQQPMNQLTTISNFPVGYSPVTLSKDCNTKKYTYTSTLSGKAPWQLFYNYNNIPDSMTIANSNFQWIAAPGLYYLLGLKDANNCMVSIGKSDTLGTFLTQDPVLQMTVGQFTVQPLGVYYYWYKNNVLIDSTTANTWLPTGDGDYFVRVRDNAGCVYTSNTIKVNYPDGVPEYVSSTEINAYPNPSASLSTVQVKDHYGTHWNYVLVDMQGNKLLQGLETSSEKVLDMSHLASGTYSLVITYEKDASRHFIRLLKN